MVYGRSIHVSKNVKFLKEGTSPRYEPSGKSQTGFNNSKTTTYAGFT